MSPPKIQNQSWKDEAEPSGFTRLSDHIGQAFLIKSGFVDDPGSSLGMVCQQLFELERVSDPGDGRSQPDVTRAVGQGIGGIVGEPLFIERTSNKKHFFADQPPQSWSAERQRRFFPGEPDCLATHGRRTPSFPEPIGPMTRIRLRGIRKS